MSLDVMISVFRPNGHFRVCIERLMRQSLVPDKIYLNVIYENEEDKEIGEYYSNEKIKVHYISAEEYDRTVVKAQIMKYVTADFVVFMNGEALPESRYMLERLIQPFDDPDVAISYARQIASEECDAIECCEYQFRYPPRSEVRSGSDIEKEGIRAYYNSDVCAAYRRSICCELDGFKEKMIACEEIQMAEQILKNGWKVSYTAEAKVICYPGMSAKAVRKKYFDLGMVQAEQEELFAEKDFKAEEIRLLRVTAAWLVRSSMSNQLGSLLKITAARFTGYQLGKHFKKIPVKICRRLSDNQFYWEEK